MPLSVRARAFNRRSLLLIEQLLEPEEAAPTQNSVHRE
eukprot:COSAG02_NODE_18398_length_941_cov_1.169834_1_plen_37_part_10